MPDLFPEIFEPDNIGLAGVRLYAPIFFAIYPDATVLPAILESRRRLVRELGLRKFAARPAGLLHVSIAECGKPSRLRQPLELALLAAFERFSFPAFDIRLDKRARFGVDDRAFVLVADEATQATMHGLRNALADAQQSCGLTGKRTVVVPHLTLGYCDELPDERVPVPPVTFRATAVDLVVSNQGHSEHLLLARWSLR